MQALEARSASVTGPAFPFLRNGNVASIQAANGAPCCLGRVDGHCQCLLHVPPLPSRPASIAASQPWPAHRATWPSDRPTIRAIAAPVVGVATPVTVGPRPPMMIICDHNGPSMAWVYAPVNACDHSAAERRIVQ